LHIDAIIGLAVEVISTILARFLDSKMCSVDSTVDAREASLLPSLLYVYSGFYKSWKANMSRVHM